MTQEIWLHREDIEEIQNVLKEFPSIATFKLIHDASSGIGYTLMMEFPHKLENREVNVSVAISDVENW